MRIIGRSTERTVDWRQYAIEVLVIGVLVDSAADEN